MFEASLGKQFLRPFSKIITAKWTGGVAEVEDLFRLIKAEKITVS
jgi:hypothetical protein